MKHVRSVKFLFSVDYASVQSTGNKNDFRYLLKQVTTLINDVDQYRDGIALVVTKVDNQLDVDEEGMGRIANNDTATLAGIAKYLKETKMSYQNLQRNLIKYRQVPANDFSNEMIKFIDILLEKQNELQFFGNYLKKDC